MTNMMLASAAALTVTKDTAAVFAAVIVGAVSLTAALTAAGVAVLTEKSRQRAANELKALELGEARIATKYALLRQAAAEFALTTVEFAECASAVSRGRSEETVQRLFSANGKLRMQYEILLLTSESNAVQESARLVLRAAWNERKDALGEPRKRLRLLGPDAAVIKEMRAHLRPFLEAVRSELGVEGDLALDLED